MSFQELDIKKEYRSLLDSVTKDFYIPLLSQAIKYQRAVGFFSSSSLVEISKGISELAKNGGKIQLVASPYLSDEDIEAIKSGYAMRDQVVKEAIRREMTEGKTPFEKARLNLLAILFRTVFWILRLPSQRTLTVWECTTKRWALSPMQKVTGWHLQDP